MSDATEWPNGNAWSSRSLVGSDLISRRLVPRTDEHRIRELGRCQVCGSARERLEVSGVNAKGADYSAIAIVCTAEGSHQPRARDAETGIPLYVRAEGRML